MSSRDTYQPGTAFGAEVRKDDKHWTLIVTRELRHAPAQVWEALTDPEELREWAPYDVDRNIGTVGPVSISTVGAPQTIVSKTEVTRAEAPSLLEYRWGDQDMRWHLEPMGSGTRLTLWHSIDSRYISMGAAGWHICLDVLDHLLAGDPLGRIVAGAAMKFDWQRLHGEYSKMLGTVQTAPPNMARG